MSGKIKALISIAIALVVIIAAVFVVTTVLGSNKDIMVYDFRVLQTNAENVDSELIDKTVYLTKEDENYFIFKVKFESTDFTTVVRFESSDDSIAIAYQDESNYICEYYRAGEATITAFVGDSKEVKDSFNIVVKENIIDSIEFEDNGFVDNTNLEFDLFCDNIERVFKYTGIGYNDGPVNLSAIELEENPQSLLSNVVLDSANQEIKIKVGKDGANGIKTFTEYLNLNIFYQSSIGKEVVKTITIKVNVRPNDNLGYIAVISNSPYFETEKFVYVQHSIRGLFKLNEGEVEVDKIILNNTYNDIYIKIYQVNTNKTRQKVEYPGYNSVSYATITYNSKNEYFKVIASGNSLGTPDESDDMFQNFGEITIEFRNPTISDLYSKDDETQIFTYTYWDDRFTRTDVICDENGHIIGFIN